MTDQLSDLADFKAVLHNSKLTEQPYFFLLKGEAT